MPEMLDGTPRWRQSLTEGILSEIRSRDGPGPTYRRKRQASPGCAILVRLFRTRRSSRHHPDFGVAGVKHVLLGGQPRAGPLVISERLTSASAFRADLYDWQPVARDLTVRLEADRPGELAGVVQALSRSGVNIEGIAEIEGVVHVLARDPSAARGALRSRGYQIDGELEVVVLPLTDRPGELAMILERLAEAEVNVRFSYLATGTRVVIGTDDVTRARQAIESRPTVP